VVRPPPPQPQNPQTPIPNPHFALRINKRVKKIIKIIIFIYFKILIKKTKKL